MLNGLKLSGLLVIFTLSLLAADAPDRSCWLRDAASPAPSTVLILCEQGGLWSTADAGATWTKFETNTTERLRAISFIDPARGFVLGDKGTLLSTTDGGKRWQPQALDTREKLMDIAFSGQNGWIAGYQGVILHSADGGRTWTKQESGTTQTLETLFFLDATHGWVVGWAGTILRTTDGGQKWEKIHTDAASWSLTSAYFRDAQNGWLVGFSGQILRSRDGGATWQVQTSPIKSWLTAVTFDRAGRGWITYDEGFLVSDDGGETWKPVPAGGRYFLGKLLNVNNSLWAIGQSVVLKQGTGNTWTRINTLTPGPGGQSNSTARTTNKP